MQALVCKAYGPIEQLQVEEMADPTPGAGEVLIDVAAAGVNFPDLLMVAGKYQIRHPTPFVPGIEFSGTVSAVGDGVDDGLIGRRVMAAAVEGGGFAEKAVVNAAAAYPVPESLSFEQAAAFVIPFGTTYYALRQCAGLREGETVLVLGAAGGVGIATVELAKAMGARVIAAASSDEKLEFARRAGADETVNYAGQSLRDELKRLTEGKGVDVVYDPVGGELAMDACKSLARKGRFLVIGFTSGTIPEFPANILLLREASIIGVYWGYFTQHEPAEHLRNMRELEELVDAGTIDVHVTASYAFADYMQAYRAISDRSLLGKIVLCPGER